MRKTKITFLAVCVLCFSTVCFADGPFPVSILSQSPTLTPTSSPSLARSYVERAATAMGGENLLAAIKILRVEYRGHSYLLDESEKDDAPWLVTYEHDTEIRDYEHQRLHRDNEHWFVTSPEPQHSAVTVKKGVAQLTIGDKHFPASSYLGEPDDSMEVLQFEPSQVVLHALESPDLSTRPDTQAGGERYHVVSFTYNGMPTRLLLSTTSGLPRAIEWTNSYPHSMFWSVWGDVESHCDLTVYKLLKQGLRIPLQQDCQRNHQPYRSSTILALEVNPEVASDAFAIDPEVEAKFREGTITQAKQPRLGKPVPIIEGDDSMVQFEDDFNCAIVRQQDGLILIEAPANSEHTIALFDEAKRRYPGLPIKAVISTSGAWAHVGGIREVVAKGIPIYAAELNRSLLERLVAAPFKLHPDDLAEMPRQPKFRWISQRISLGTGPNRIEIMPISNVSGGRMLMLYLPAHNLLYTSDLVQPLEDGSFFWPEYLWELNDDVQRQHLNVERFFGMHATATSWNAVQRSLAQSSPAGQSEKQR